MPYLDVLVYSLDHTDCIGHLPVCEKARIR